MFPCTRANVPNVPSLHFLSELMTCPATCVFRASLCRVSMATVNSATGRRLSRILKRVCQREENLPLNLSLFGFSGEISAPLTSSASFRPSSDPRGHRSGSSRAGRPRHHTRLQLRLPSKHRRVRPSRGAHGPSRVGLLSHFKPRGSWGFVFDVCFFIVIFGSRRLGAAVTLMSRENWKMAAELIPILERAGQVRKTGSSSKI